MPPFEQINKKEKIFKKNNARTLAGNEAQTFEDGVYDDSGSYRIDRDFVDVEAHITVKDDSARDVDSARAQKKSLGGGDDDLKRDAYRANEAKATGKKVVFDSECQVITYDEFKGCCSKVNYKSQVSYVWVDNSTEANVEYSLPATRQDHGLINVISNAKSTPDVRHIIYVDRRTAGSITSPDFDMPGNVVIAPVSYLFKSFEGAIDRFEIKGKMAVLRIKSLLLGNNLDVRHRLNQLEFMLEAPNKMQALYQAELLYGKPAFAKNILSLVSIGTGAYFFDIGVKIIPGKRLHQRLISGGSGAVMKGSYILGAYDRKQVGSIMYELYNRYTGNVGTLEKPAFNPKKAVTLLRELFKDPLATQVDVSLILNGSVAKYYEPMSAREFVESSVEISRLLYEKHMEVTSDNARLNDSVFGNTLGAFQPQEPYRLNCGLDFFLSHQRSHLPSLRKDGTGGEKGQDAKER